jgi:hypothetical protein
MDSEISQTRQWIPREIADSSNFQSKVEELLVQYLDGPETDREEIARLTGGR